MTRSLLMAIAPALLLLVGACASAPPREATQLPPGWGRSEWVFPGPEGKLVYRTTDRGDRIMDFSHAGYMAGGVAIPEVPVRRRVAPSGGDDTGAIQAALDAVAALPLIDGFRGAVLLAPGAFTTSETLRISSSGIVLRGGGSGEGGTRIRMAGPRHRFLNIGGNGSPEPQGEPVRIMDAYIPSGATWFTVRVAEAANFQPGDAVLIRRPTTEAWIEFMGMDTLQLNGNRQTWIEAGTLIDAERTVQSVVGYRITLDVPLSDSYDARLLDPPGTTIVKYTFPGRIEQVGLEGIRIGPAAGGDTTVEHSLLGLSAVQDAWVRDVVADEMRDAMTISGTARRITLQEIHFFHSEDEPHQGGSSPAHIAISGSQVLIDRSSSVGKRMWPIVTQGMVTGPNVVLNFSADEAGVSPHQRWATGLLVDGGEYRNNWEWRPGVALANRQYAGSGHGWSAGWSVVWNVESDYLLIEQPPGGANWSIGSTARYTTVLWNGIPLPVPPLPSDRIESIGLPVEPRSLYLAQLRERLGTEALRNIGYGGR
jgi:hypothetical protein